MSITIRQLGLQDYETVWQAMQRFTLDRTPETDDQIWIVEHKPVYTLGLNGKREHLLNTGPIPVVQCDRGGQVTYHGPGQLVVYPLLNIKRRELGVRPLVTLLEQTMIAVLAHYGIHALARPEAPGVYVDGKKIGSIGIRIRNNCCYHGLSLNNAMDLTPFKFINPCGYAGLEVTQLADLGVAVDFDELAERLLQILTEKLPS
ncbi:lipoyl(octanoyl) transferase LipB [Candidatus Methylomicrobium oryzae]|jgi:lipoyl(octanoyl) transferase|uniref:lipoyl(octanoyl) transferase LipB n=1 Tax=Candidatus Methylomicrobium oryzae TaxID=2802053 RepID=UPI001922CAE7|nr:lipoyl(octanoyl) transferase LipB [Methylomicrobium sp. RS1]MBL1263115.1 lipoyl(octanoyl) transferase LipB [Methylomicrobium sp. RS1]